ncbi:MAG: hypothetical protein JXA68_03100 [Ignavibacteriales bacterium]|nr:hypothetical protein [Ignavibacteriales bacterium]
MILKLKNTLKFKFIFIAVLLSANILLQFIPLINVIGYEISAINGIFLFFLGGIYTIHFYKKDNSKNIKVIISENFSIYILLLFIPIVISLTSTYLFQKCPVLEGLGFYFVITIPSLIIGIFFGGFISQVFKKYFYIGYIIFFLIMCFIPVFEIFFYPQIYFYSPIIGFFSGTIYDEDITISSTLFLYRFLNIAFFMILYYLSYYCNKGKHKNLKIILFIFVSIIIFLLKPQIGFSTSVDRLESELGGKIETEHFTTIYCKAITDEEITNLCLLQEFYYEDIKNLLKDEPKEKIISFIFSTGEQKRELFGSNVANVAKPWSNQIYLNFDSYDQSLKHELAHIFSANYGFSIFKMSGGFNPAMLEGFAMAIENEYDYNSVHYIAAVAFHNGYKIEIENLFSGFNFFGSVSSLSYIYSGSFVKFLMDNYGIEKIKEVYGKLEFENIYKKSLDSLFYEYEKFISNVKVDSNVHLANIYFGRKPIFQKICPRYTANRLKDANDFFSNGFYEDAFEIYDEIYSYTESYSSLIGKVNCLVKLNKNQSAFSVLVNEIPKFENTSYYYYFELLLGDICVRNSNFALADSIYKVIVLQNPNITYFLNASTKNKLLSIDTNLILKYVLGSNYDKYQILKKLNQSEVFIPSIPLLVELSESLKENVDDLFSFLKDRIEVNNYVSSHSAFYISKYALRKSKYNVAVFYANESMKYYSNESFYEILKYNLNKTNWLVYNSEKIRKNLKVIRK